MMYDFDDLKTREFVRVELSNLNIISSIITYIYIVILDFYYQY